MKPVIVCSLMLLAPVAAAQVSVNIGGSGVSVQTGGAAGTSVATNTAGSLGPDVQMEGVAVINGEVYIDGVKVPRGKSSFVSKKSGKAYVIQWGKDGNVAVHEK